MKNAMQFACRKVFRMLAMVLLFCKGKMKDDKRKLKINKFQNNKISS